MFGKEWRRSGSMMTSTLPSVFAALFIGAFATALLDAWALTLNRALKLPVTDWGHVGRWVAGIPSGTLRHSSIALAPQVANERLLGWLTHYAVGVSYAALYLGLMAAIARPPGIYSAVAFGVATVLAPWLILQPCLGLGYFAQNAPRPARTRALNLAAHAVFGVGLYAGAAVTGLAS
jgi:hypothetical protein